MTMIDSTVALPLNEVLRNSYRDHAASPPCATRLAV